MPLNPSFPPSSKITRSGLCSLSNFGSLYRPPDVVSPLIPALMILILISRAFKFLSRTDGHDSSIFTPYPALKLSPKTTAIYSLFLNCSDEFTDEGSVSRIPKSKAMDILKNFILEVKNITIEVNSPEGLLTIVKDINLSVEQGKPISLVGPSGSGKTTLLAIMAGLDLPTSGTVTLMGSQITTLDEDKRAQIRGKDVGFVFQSFHLMPRLTALDNVMLPLEISGDPYSMDKAQEALKQVGLSKRAKHFATQLSGGEKQRVAIARSIVNKPKILFADEPTGNLDKKSSGSITDLLFSLNELINTTLVLVTHDLSLAEKCDEVYELAEGRLL